MRIRSGLSEFPRWGWGLCAAVCGRRQPWAGQPLPVVCPWAALRNSGKHMFTQPRVFVLVWFYVTHDSAFDGDASSWLPLFFFPLLASSLSFFLIKGKGKWADCPAWGAAQTAGAVWDWEWGEHDKCLEWASGRLGENQLHLTPPTKWKQGWKWAPDLWGNRLLAFGNHT